MNPVPQQQSAGGAAAVSMSGNAKGLVRGVVADQQQMIWVVVLTGLLALSYLLPNIRIFQTTADYAPVHSGLELLAIAVAMMVAALAWNLRGTHSNCHYLLLGAGFLAVGAIDIGHVLSYVGMPDFVTANTTAKAINFWLAGRFIAAGALLAVALLQPRTVSGITCRAAMPFALAITVVVYWVGLQHDAQLPLMHIPGEGLTSFKIGTEYLLTTLYALAAVLLFRRGHAQKNADMLWLAAAAWTQGLSELFFTQYRDVTDLSNLLGHIYKVFASAMVYRAIFVAGIQQPYRELALERSWAQSLLASIPNPVWLKNADGVYLSCNTAYEQLFGVTAADVIGYKDHDIFPQEYADSFRHYDQLALTMGQPSSNEEWVPLASGALRLFETTKTPTRLADGSVVGVLGIAHDITEQKRIEEEMRLAATTFESREGIFITDANKVIQRVNKAFTQITGYTPEEAIGQTPRIFKSGRHDESFYAAMQQSLEKSDSWHGEIWNMRKNGEVFPEWLRITAVRSNDGILTHYVANLTDESERKAASDRITYLSLYDSLTQLPNRKLMRERLDQAVRNSIRHERQGALLIIDVDNFKALNEAQGHHAGDQLLVDAAARLFESISSKETIARIGGDEFAVILEDIDTDGAGAIQAKARAREILAHISKPYRLQLPGGEQSYQGSCSVGIALFGSAGDSGERLLQRADTAMHQAKALGRDSICFFDPQMQAAIEAHAALEVDLRCAIAEQQLTLHYQPQVNASGQVVGAEALIRWHHPQQGMVSPARFIPLAEESGLIVPLGHWVLKTACEQLAQWSNRPALASLNLSVNISARQFAQPDFVEQVEILLQQTGAPAHRLKLELTESLLAKDTKDVISKMRMLRSKGVCFALDDFGTGYSSLSYVKQLPLQQLKIDQSFVRDVVSDPNDAAIANTIIALGRTLGLDVIAEGVETEEQRNFLDRNGCCLFQGYLFCKPVPLETFESFALAVTEKELT